MYCLHFQSWRTSEPCSVSKEDFYVLGITSWSDSRALFVTYLCWFLAWLIIRLWRWRWHVPPKHRWTFNGLHSVISQKDRPLHDHRCKNGKSYSVSILPPDYTATYSRGLCPVWWPQKPQVNIPVYILHISGKEMIIVAMIHRFAKQPMRNIQTTEILVGYV
jgi:hypothetical protein